MNPIGEFDPIRWTIYLTLGPLLLGAFFLVRSNWHRALGLLFVLVFVDGVVMSSRTFFVVGFSISSAFAYVLFGSLMLSAESRRRMPDMTVIWALLLASAGLGAVIGLSQRGFDLSSQLPRFQFYFVEALLYYTLGRTLLRNPRQAQGLVTWLVLFGGIVALLHMFSLATGFTFYASGKYAAAMIEAEKNTFRYGSVFINPNTLADFYAMVLPAAIVLLFGWSKLPRMAFHAVFASAGLIAISLPLTASRGGLAATALTLATAVLLLPLSVRQVVSLLGAGIAIGGASAAGLLLLFPDFLEQVLARFDELGVGGGRYRLWAASLSLILHNPLGVGLHGLNFEHEILRYGQFLSSPHNIYLGIAANAGIAALAAFLLLVLSSLRRLRTARRSDDLELRTTSTAVLVMLLGFLIAGITEPIFGNGYKLQHIFFLLLGLGSYTVQWLPEAVAAGRAHTAPLMAEREAAVSSPIRVDAGAS